MHRSLPSLLFVLLLPLVAAGPTAAQSDQPRVYEMYFQVDFPDVPDWIEFYRTHEVPVLEALVDEGILQDFELWVHDTGGEYNLRYNIVAPSWGALGDFTDAYFARVDAQALGAVTSMIRKHTDQIWVIGPNDFPDGWREAPLVYESAFQLEFNGVEQWSADFREYSEPALQRAVEEGLISAWVALGHDTGGPYNAKYIYWLESWDAADDAVAFVGEVSQDLGMGMESARAIQRHTDTVWRTVPRR